MVSPNHKNMTLEIQISNHNKYKWLKVYKKQKFSDFIFKNKLSFVLFTRDILKNDIEYSNIKLESLIGKIKFVTNFRAMIYYLG